jgi:hypothetical protein
VKHHFSLRAYTSRGSVPDAHGIGSVAQLSTPRRQRPGGSTIPPVSTAGQAAESKYESSGSFDLASKSQPTVSRHFAFPDSYHGKAANGAPFRFPSSIRGAGSTA